MTLLLSEIPEKFTKNGFLISIGESENTETRIKDLKAGNSKNISTPGVLNCTQDRDFWVYWDSKVVKIGRGRYEEGSRVAILTLEHTFPKTEIRAASLWGHKDTYRKWEVSATAASGKILMHFVVVMFRL